MADGPLPLLHRAAIAYLAAPLGLWLLGWLRLEVAVPAAALLAAGLWRTLSGPWRTARPSRTAAVLVLASLALVALTPAGGILVDATFLNWPTHRGVLLDLVRGRWPAYLPDYLGNGPLLLRYYLGWYLPPALAARATGVASLDWAVPLWTWLGLALFALLAARPYQTLRAALIAVAVLFFFNGLDPLDDRLAALLEAFADAPAPAESLHYDSFYWMFHSGPQHAATAGLGTLLLLQLRNHPRFLGAGGVVWTTCAFWSPIAALGLAPLAAASLVRRGRLRATLSWQNAAALPLAGLVALYLAGGEVGFPRAWVWNLWEDPWHLAARLALLYATEFLVVAVLVWRAAPATAREPCFVAALVALLAAPLFFYGTNPYSEWTVKFSLAAQVAVAYCAAWVLAGRSPKALGATTAPTHGGAGLLAAVPAQALGMRPRRGRSVAYWLLAGALVVGAVPMLRTMARSRFHPVAHEWTGESLITDVRWDFVRQRTASKLPRLLAVVLRGPHSAAGGLGARVIEARYDLHLDGRSRLVYARRDCDLESELRTWLFLEVHYDDADRLPWRSNRPPWDEWTVRASHDGRERLLMRLEPRHFKDGGCIAGARLRSDGPIRIRTGQLGVGGRTLWEAEARLNE